MKKDVAVFEAANEQKQRLEGERTELENNHKKIKEEYQEFHDNKRGPTQADAMKGLLTMDAARYGNLMQDLNMGNNKASEPIWANLPILGQPNGHPSQDPMTNIKTEIERLTAEKSEFAAELEKAQNLLGLQQDISKENDVYYMHEEKRLTLIQKSVSAKVEELSRRADDKAKTVADFNRSTLIRDEPTRPSIDEMDELRSEFSADTHESRLGDDSNILDFKIEDAEYYRDAIDSLSAFSMASGEMDNKFITVVTIDFYNHSTETT